VKAISKGDSQVGIIITYQCNNCNYEICSWSGPGFYVEKEAMLCVDCKEIVDVLVKILPLGYQEGKGNPGMLDICPLCKGKNLKKIGDAVMCPKCGSKMILEDGGCWD
jgi:hypothetical protein